MGPPELSPSHFFSPSKSRATSELSLSFCSEQGLGTLFSPSKISVHLYSLISSCPLSCWSLLCPLPSAAPALWFFLHHHRCFLWVLIEAAHMAYVLVISGPGTFGDRSWFGVLASGGDISGLVCRPWIGGSKGVNGCVGSFRWCWDPGRWWIPRGVPFWIDWPASRQRWWGALEFGPAVGRSGCASGGGGFFFAQPISLLMWASTGPGFCLSLVGFCFLV